MIYDVYANVLVKMCFTVEANDKDEARNIVSSHDWDNKIREHIRKHSFDYADIVDISENKNEFYCLDFEDCIG